MSAILRHARRARKFFPLCSRAQRASQSAKYARSVALLGANWLFIRNVERLMT